MSRTTECKHCDRPITFEKAGSRWIPKDPQTGERHRCKAEVKCKGCGVIFEGEPWKDLCSVCWDADRLDKNRVNRGRGAPQKRQGAEPLRGTWDDADDPF